MRPDPTTIEELRTLARRRLPRFVFDYIDGGAESETTLRRNVEAFAVLGLRPHALAGVSHPDQRVTLFGEVMRTPVILAPAGLAGLVHPAGEGAAAIGARRMGTVSVVSTISNATLSEVAQAAGAAQWAQVFPWSDSGRRERFLDIARAAGTRVLVATIDAPIAGGHDRDRRNGITVPPRLSPRVFADILRSPRWGYRAARSRPLVPGTIAQLEPDLNSNKHAVLVRATQMLDPACNWDDLAALVSRWEGPVIAKGVMTGEDAQSALSVGCAGVIVSNHGGRQADGLPASISVLPEVVDAVAGGCPVLVDGGIRCGTDIIKAIALGATACLVGRPWLYGLGALGAEGPAVALRILTDEVARALTLIGRSSLDELDASACWPLNSRPPRTC